MKFRRYWPTKPHLRHDWQRDPLMLEDGTNVLMEDGSNLYRN